MSTSPLSKITVNFNSTTEVKAEGDEDNIPTVEEADDLAYFDNDPADDIESEELDDFNQKRKMSPNNTHEIYFKPRIFVKYFFSHLIFFFMLGPFIVILSPIFGYECLYNQAFFGIQKNFFVQATEFVMIITLIVVYYLEPSIELRSIEIFSLVVASIIRCITIACKYAYASEAYNKFMKERKLTDLDREAEFMLTYWRPLGFIPVLEEIQAGLLRLEIESSMFFFDFLGNDKQKELNRKLMKKNLGELIADWEISFAKPTAEKPLELDCSKINDNNPTLNTLVTPMEEKKNSTDILNSGLKILGAPIDSNNQESSSVNNHIAFLGLSNVNPILTLLKSQAQVHSNFELLSNQVSRVYQPKKFERSKLYGYSLAFDLLMKGGQVRFQHPGKVCILISFIKAWIPTFYRIYLGENPFTNQPYLVAFTIIINTLFFTLNSFIVSISLTDIQTKLFCLKQLGSMISPRKINSYLQRKYYPTINIFDPVTVKTWINLRKLIINFGDKFAKRNAFNVTIVLVIYMFVLAFLVVQILGIVKSQSDPLLVILLSIETLFYFLIFMTLLFGSALCNEQFRIHKSLLQINKTIVSDFLRLSSHYFGKNPVNPDNRIYRAGVKILKAEFGETNLEQKVMERTSKLVDIFEDAIQELEFEEMNAPIKVLGFKADFEIIKRILAGIGALLFAIAQIKWLN